MLSYCFSLVKLDLKLPLHLLPRLRLWRLEKTRVRLTKIVSLNGTGPGWILKCVFRCVSASSYSLVLYLKCTCIVKIYDES